MSFQPDYIPADYQGIKIVSGLSALFNAEFNPANCILYPRRLAGDFNGLAQALYSNRSGAPLERVASVAHQAKTDAVTAAAAIMPTDMEAYDAQSKAEGINPHISLRVTIWDKKRVFDSGSHALHRDGANNVRMGRLLACYHGPATEWACDDDIHELVPGDPVTRYGLNPGARIHQFHAGDIWRQAVRGGPVKPFTHRVPHDFEISSCMRLLFVGA